MMSDQCQLNNTTTHDYDGSQVLFRYAKARVAAARRFAAEVKQEQELGGSGSERRQRERDAVITVLILTQGAAESYANWVHLKARTSLKFGHSWIERWEMLPDTVAKMCNQGEQGEFVLSEEHHAFLKVLGAWRNFLLHADAHARKRLRKLLADDLSEGTSERDLLTADFAETVLQKAEQIFRWAERNTGVQAPFLDLAWVAADEC